MGKHHPDGGKPPIGRSGPLLEINAKKDIPWDVFFALAVMVLKDEIDWNI